MKIVKILVFLSVAVLSLQGCQTGREASPFTFLEGRQVQVEKVPNYISKLSHCVMVMPVTIVNERLKIYGPNLEDEFARYAREKFDVVIKADEVRKVADTNGYIPTFSRDQQQLRQKLNCETVLQGRLVGPGEKNFLVWSGHEVGIEISFPDALSMKNIWQGRHVTSRSAGGIPLSPVGVLIDTTKAQMMAMNSNDVVASVISDGVRRIMAYFPKVS